MDKQFTVKDLERAADRGCVMGQIEILKDVIKSVRNQSATHFQNGEDEAAKALRDVAVVYEGSVLPGLERKLESMKSKVRSAQITDTVIDAGLEVNVEE